MMPALTTFVKVLSNQQSDAAVHSEEIYFAM